MEMSVKEVKDLMRKWQTENRVIHGAMWANGVISKVVGRIDALDDRSVHLSAAKLHLPLGEAQFIEFPLRDSAFAYSDAEHAPEPLNKILAGYDAILSVRRFGVLLGFAVIPPLDDWVE